MKGEREIKKMGKKYVGRDTAERNPVQETNKSFLYTSTATTSKLSHFNRIFLFCKRFKNK